MVVIPLWGSLITDSILNENVISFPISDSLSMTTFKFKISQELPVKVSSASI